MTKKFKNRYFAIRHGESKANKAGIILSDLKEGKKEKYSLTDKGKEQVKESIQIAKGRYKLGGDVTIVSSPFSRCKKTAEIAKNSLGVQSRIVVDDRLRERWFGKFEGGSHDLYKKVWLEDKNNIKYSENDIESVSMLEKRLKSFIDDTESKYKDKVILLSTHGDVLRVLYAIFHKIPIMEIYVKNKKFKTAEIIKLT